MFEEEAEDNKPPYACCSFNTGCELWEDGFQKGAGFGYNKAKKELAERLDEAKEMLEQFIKFSMFPLTTKKDIEDVQILLKSASQFCKEME